jgi:hypothetical protein
MRWNSDRKMTFEPVIAADMPSAIVYMFFQLKQSQQSRQQHIKSMFYECNGQNIFSHNRAGM